MKSTDIYGTSARSDQAAPAVQPVSQPASPARDTAPKAPSMADHAVTVSWFGVLLALIALRVIYEVSE